VRNVYERLRHESLTMPEQIELFGEGAPARDAAFLHIVESTRPEPKRARDLIDSLWRQTAAYLERGIPNRMRFEFHACFWEMYLAAILLDHQLQVVSREKRSHSSKGPDIQVGNVDAWFEAIAAAAGEGPDAVPGYSFGKVARVPDEQFKLRLMGAIQTKFLIYQSYLSKGWVKESEPFVIAVNAGDIPHVHQELPLPRIISAVFPFGYEVVRFDVQTNAYVDSHFTHQGDVRKKSGASVPTTYFEQEPSRGISAIVYATADAFNCRGMPGADFILTHNPLATAPLPRGFLPVGRECWRDGKELVIHDHRPLSGTNADGAPEE
jgi:hypothetical protein